LRGRSLLAVGAGQMGALTARAGLTAGADVAIASRTWSHAQALARQLGARSLQFDPGRAVADFGAVIVALRGPWSLSGATEEALRTGGPVVVDLSTPRAFGDDLAAALGDRFIAGDAFVFLETEEARLGRRVIARLDELIDGAATEFLRFGPDVTIIQRASHVCPDEEPTSPLCLSARSGQSGSGYCCATRSSLPSQPRAG
jgi:glutamyl-tRNA reductase